MNTSPKLIVDSLITKNEEVRFKQALSWTVGPKQHWAVVGPNGAGKTLFIDTIAGKYALKSGDIRCVNEKGEEQKKSQFIKTVAFRDIYSMTETRDAFYQQRWNMGVMQDNTPAKDLLPTSSQTKWGEYLITKFNIEELLEKDIRLLSSGELRKFLIIKSLLSQPGILILDNPYIGLDVHSRKILNQLFSEIAAMGEVQIVLVLANITDIPEMITDILPIVERELLPTISKSDFFTQKEIQEKLFPPFVPTHIDFPHPAIESFTGEEIVKLNNIHIRYGKRIILDQLNWQINKGEHWALLGPNGSGKSTLLSLLSGDNPQAFANDIHLFGRKKGTGESIWDIKKRIGYISPEMHLHYLKNIPCIDIVASGYFDTIGLYLTCSDEQKKNALQWMELFGIAHLRDASFLQISSGEQRLVLLTRVFVKNPDLLILDEPMHGLDSNHKENVKNIIKNFCNNKKTLIFVSHYDQDIPSVVTKHFVLVKR